MTGRKKSAWRSAPAGRGSDSMIELCFDQSTQGALRCAQHCGAESRKAFGAIFGYEEAGGSGENVESTIVIGSDDGKKPTKREIRQVLRDFQRKQEALEREAVPLGGNAGDVLALSLGLDMGDIREPLGESRHQLQRQWYGSDGTGHQEQALRAADRDWQETLEAAERLRALGPGDAVRVWVDQTPHSACGLLHAASLLKGTNAAVSVVTLPPWRALSDNAVETYLGWGEVAPELFGHFLSREEPLPPAGAGSPWRDGGGSSRRRTPPSGRWSTALSAAWGRTSTTALHPPPHPGGPDEDRPHHRRGPGPGEAGDRRHLAGLERIRWMLSAGELRMVEEDRSGFTAPWWKGLDISREIGKIKQTIWVRRRADRRRLPPHP